MYPFTIPRTQKIVFEEYMIENHVVTSSVIRQFAGAREKIRNAIEKNDLEEALLAVPFYMPYALSLEFFNGVFLPIRNGLIFKWKTAVGLRDKKGRFTEMTYHDARCEVGFTLFTYATTMCLKANKILGDLTLEKTLLEEDYNNAADMLARAAGIFHFIAKYVAYPPNNIPLPLPRQPDLIPHVPLALSFICVANAQRVVIRKAIESGYRFQTIARISVAAAEKFREAWKTLLELGSEFDNLDHELREYVKYNADLQDALTLKYMAMHNNIKSEMGKAITFMDLASEKIQSVIKNSKSSIVTELARKEFEVIEVKLASYHRTNNSTLNEVPSSKEEATAEIPDGELIMKLKEYNPPISLFALDLDVPEPADQLNISQAMP